MIRLHYDSYLIVIVKKVSQNVNQGRSEEFGFTNVTDFQDILVFAQVQVQKDLFKKFEIFLSIVFN